MPSIQLASEIALFLAQCSISLQVVTVFRLSPPLPPSRASNCHDPCTDKLDGKDLELRCLFPPPGRAVRGSELDEATVESVGLVPRGRLMVQFR